MYDPEETKQMYNWLQAICNTCLIASKEELGKMIDYPSLKDNDLSKKFKTTDGNMKEFLIRSTFHEFEHKVSEESDELIVLSEWLDKYKKASEEYKKRITFWKGKTKEKQESLLGYILFSHIIDDIHKDNLGKYWDEKEKEGVDLEILLLISLKILPFYNGKGEAEDEPVSVLLKFLKDPFNNGALEPLENIYQMLIDDEYKNSRINSVIKLRKTVKQIKNIFKPEFLEELFYKNNVDILTRIGLQNDADQDILWTDGINSHVFYIFDPSIPFLYKNDIRKKEYTCYEIEFSSEYGEKYGRIINPQFIPALMKNIDEDIYHNQAIFTWKFDKNSISFSIIESPYTKPKEWVKTFRKLKLTRIEKNDSSYNTFAAESINKKSFYKNKYPGPEYLFFPTVHSITYDNCVIVNDITLNEQRDFVRDTSIKYEIDSKWFGDERINIDTPIGVIIFNYKDNPEQWEKYIYIPFKNLFFPIINGEVIFPDDPT